jgi:hypothetical protein
VKYITLCAFQNDVGLFYEKKRIEERKYEDLGEKSSNDVRKMDSLSLCMSFQQQTVLKFKEEASEVLHLEYNSLVLKLGHL